MEETKSRRVFDFTSRDVPRVDEGKKERKKERARESSFSTREIVVLVVLVVVWCAILFSSSLSKQKDTQGTGTQFFPHFFFFAENQTKQREKK